METNVVSWFEIPVTDLARARKFYAAVLNKELTDAQMPGMEMAMFPWAQGKPHAAGCLVRSEWLQPSPNGTTVYFQCDDLANELSRVEPNGGKIITPKTSIGEWGFIAHFTDTEGNRVALSSPK